MGDTSDEADAEFGSSGDESAQSLESAVGNAVQRPTAKAAAKRASVFFGDEDLGIVRYDLGFRRASKCYLCSQQIATADAIRAAYAYHSKRPHSYLHLDCVMSLEKRFLQVAADKLVATALPDNSNLQRRVAEARREILRKLRE